MRGATTTIAEYPDLFVISIHAPHAGRDTPSRHILSSSP